MSKQKYDARSAESAADTHERFFRVLHADISWWRENASVVRDRNASLVAIQVAEAIENVLHRIYPERVARADGAR